MQRLWRCGNSCRGDTRRRCWKSNCRHGPWCHRTVERGRRACNEVRTGGLPSLGAMPGVASSVVYFCAGAPRAHWGNVIRAHW
eukprot:2295367-Pleurochrysis_carterae.AAC.1